MSSQTGTSNEDTTIKDSDESNEICENTECSLEERVEYFLETFKIYLNNSYHEIVLSSYNVTFTTRSLFNLNLFSRVEQLNEVVPLVFAELYLTW